MTVFESSQLPPSPAFQSDGPPDVSGLRPERLPPIADDLGGASIAAARKRAAAGASVDPEETANRRQPGRYLDPEVAASVKRAKERTGRTWRWVAKWTGVSHPHLVLISQGKRVPSRRVVQALADLPFEPGGVGGTVRGGCGRSGER